jgi:hypothetical protein
VSTKLYGGITEQGLRETVLGADRGTIPRATAELLDELDELRDALRLVAHRTPWDQTCCWCAVAPFDDRSTKEWRHDQRCREIRELIDA